MWKSSYGEDPLEDSLSNGVVSKSLGDDGSDSLCWDVEPDTEWLVSLTETCIYMHKKSIIHIMTEGTIQVKKYTSELVTRHHQVNWLFHCWECRVSQNQVFVVYGEIVFLKKSPCLQVNGSHKRNPCHDPLSPSLLFFHQNSHRRNGNC